MDKLNDSKRGTFMWALSLSIGFPVGVAMIVVGFILGKGFIAMAVIGILLAVAGFYVMPLLWVRFGTLRYYISIAREIEDGVKSVSMLAETHRKQPEVMANDIKTMIQKNYLPGYVVLDNENIVNRRAMNKFDYEALEAERTGSLSLVHCPFCNAKFQLILGVGECPYCNSKVTKEMIDSNALKAYNKKSNNDGANSAS